MRFISGSPMPRVVTAGVPIRTPEVTSGLFVSKGIAFLLTVMLASSSQRLGLLARSARRADVDEHQMVLGAPGDEPRAAFSERGRERPRRSP